MAHLGEPGTEQFTVETRLDGIVIGKQAIHDPLISTTVVIDWRDALRILLRRGRIKVMVSVHGSHAAMRRIMTLDPVDMQRENAEHERFSKERRSEPSGADAMAVEP